MAPAAVPGVQAVAALTHPRRHPLTTDSKYPTPTPTSGRTACRWRFRTRFYGIQVSISAGSTVHGVHRRALLHTHAAFLSEDAVNLLSIDPNERVTPQLGSLTDDTGAEEMLTVIDVGVIPPPPMFSSPPPTMTAVTIAGPMNEAPPPPPPPLPPPDEDQSGEHSVMTNCCTDNNS